MGGLAQELVMVGVTKNIHRDVLLVVETPLRDAQAKKIVDKTNGKVTLKDISRERRQRKQNSPAGDTHKSASSLLAEIMNDPKARRVVVFTFDGEGGMSFAHFECTRSELAYASVIADKHTAEGALRSVRAIAR